ncbi:MAG: Asp23/Gls24 family envelope stress response protein [Bacillota bacterium]|nr:MAG: Asp23/Gls24 family envelope stress response protein [Bacillota bacterium]
MAQEIETPEGKIIFSSDVIATIAGLAAMECYGVVGMAARSLQDGLAGILGRENLTRGVQVSSQDGQLVITLGIIVGYGARISEVAANVVDRVRYSVEQATGLKVKRVNINVAGVKGTR